MTIQSTITTIAFIRGKNVGRKASQFMRTEANRPRVFTVKYQALNVLSLALLLLLGTFTVPNEAVIGGLHRIAGSRRKPKVSMYTFTKTEEDDNFHPRLRALLLPQKAVTSAPSSHGATNAGTSKLAEITDAFRNAVSKQQRQTDIHVGKFLSAMDKMESHMRYVGMIQGANDLKSNYEKAMRLYKAAPTEKRDSIADLLQWEIESGVHGPIETASSQGGMRLKNNSGAMGLSWLGRSVEYQYDLYRLMLEEGHSPKEAAAMAFQQDLEPHLDWASSRLGRAAIPRLIPASQTQFFSKLGGYTKESYGPNEDARMRNDVQSILGVWNGMIDEWRSAFDKLDLRDI